jgi:hypothetical protein
MIIRSPRLQPGKTVFSDAKRLLQRYRHLADVGALPNVRFALAKSSHSTPFQVKSAFV